MAGKAHVGRVLAGKYLVERVLGEGGMGVVVAARHLHLNDQVALKFMLPAVLTVDATAGKRFLREAQVVFRLRSEHVTRVLDVGTLEDGAPYIVMEYLEGMTLAELVLGRGPLPLARAVDYVLQACEALAEAHSIGVVHRDLKPQNLFLTHRLDGSPLIKVLDFGISKLSSELAGAAAASLTQGGTMLGSPQYMSPEQIAAPKKVDGRADIWALGVILYELLTGRVPFQARSVVELCMKVVNEPAPPLADQKPDLPRGFAAIVDRCLAKEPHRRYADVAELAGFLARFAAPGAAGAAERVRRILTSERTPVPVVIDAEPAAPGGAPTPQSAGADPRAALARTKIGLGDDGDR
jgi:serine/threonine-protein kinase